MINNLKIIEDDDTHIVGFMFKKERFSYTVKDTKDYLYTGLEKIPKKTRIIMWPNKWSYEKDLECEELCQRLFQS